MSNKKVDIYEEFKNDKYYLCNDYLPLQTNLTDIIELRAALINHYNIYVKSLKQITKSEYMNYLKKMKNVYTDYFEIYKTCF